MDKIAVKCMKVIVSEADESDKNRLRINQRNVWKKFSEYLVFPGVSLLAYLMTKAKIWCCHPVRHSEASKVGRVPSHPKGKYLVSSKLVKFLKRQYGLYIFNPSQSKKAKLYMCTSCYQYEVDRLERFKTLPNYQQLWNSADQRNDLFQLRSSMDSLSIEDDCEISSSQRVAAAEQADASSGDALDASYDRYAVKEMFNDVFRILKIEPVVDTRNTDILSNTINNACEVLQKMCENFIKNKKQRTNVDLADQKEPWVLSLSEKDELLNGLKNLYNASDRIEQVRLLTIAPGHWGRQKVQHFFDSSERQARRSRELRLTEGVLASPEETRGNQPLDSSIIQAVVQFYEQDWISRVSPNKSDVILIRKQSVAKRFMLLTIGEAFEKFKNDFPQYPIGRSKFFNLKPRHVYPIALHDTCCCIYHENFDLLLKAWNRISNDQINKQKLIDETLCSPASDLCFYQDCQKCSNRYPSSFLRNHFDGNEDDDTEWVSWKRTNNRVALQQIAGCVSLLLDDIDEQWENFLSHHYYTKMQHAYITEIKKASDPNNVIIIQMDFAQNFALTSQHEIQSAHFDKPQATVFTAFVVIGSGHKNFVIISNYLEHDTKFVYVVQQLLISRVKQVAPCVQKVNYVTDGGPSHFKNRYNMLNLTFHEIDFGVRAVWTFFATSHGKGPADGLGAAVKSTATRYLMRHGPEEAFKSAKEFYQFSKQQHEPAQSPIELFYVESDEVVRLHAERNVNRWEKTNALTGIRSFHHFEPIGSRTIQCRRTSTSTIHQTYHL